MFLSMRRQVCVTVYLHVYVHVCFQGVALFGEGAWRALSAHLSPSGHSVSLADSQEIISKLGERHLMDPGRGWEAPSVWKGLASPPTGTPWQ